MNTNRDVLFYSQSCDYCRNVIDIIISYNIRDYFIMICVDTNIQRLPEFVDRVPLIYRKNIQQVLIDDDVLAYIDSIIKSVSQPSSQHMLQQQKEREYVDSKNTRPAPTPQQEEVLPFSLQQNDNYSDSFSFLGESIENNPLKKNYTMIGVEDRMIPLPSDEDVGKSKFDTKILDDYMKSRDNDTADFKQKMNNGMQPLVR